MLQIVVVLTDELVAKGGRHENARGEVRVLKNSETVAEREGVGVQELQKIGLGVLCVFPVSDGGG